MDYKLIKPKVKNNTEFMKAIKSKVNIALDGKPGKDNNAIYLKSMIILLWASLSFMGLFLFDLAVVKLFFALSLGVASAGLGFNLFHDANHGSLSSSKKVNHFCSFLCSSIGGASSYFWKYKHNYLHHQFPNIQNWDDDLETREGLRLSPSAPWSIRYKYQHIYAPIMYALTTIEWFFIKDYIQYFTLKMNRWQKIPKMKKADHIEFWITKLIYYSLFIVFPLLYIDVATYLIGFVIYHFSYSLALASIFQLAHVMEELEFVEADDKTGQLDIGWAELQLMTTTNFSTNNNLITWFAGGLNYQVEHHIFPNISHTFYPQIAPILKETCQEFGYPYHNIDNYSDAISSHFRTLKRFGFEAYGSHKLGNENTEQIV